MNSDGVTNVSQTEQVQSRIPRFSWFSTVLLIGVIALTISHFGTSFRLRQTENELGAYRQGGFETMRQELLGLRTEIHGCRNDLNRLSGSLAAVQGSIAALKSKNDGGQ